MAKIASNPSPGSIIGFLKGVPIALEAVFFDFFNDLERELNTNLLGQALILKPYTVATLPDAETFIDGAIIVTNETGGRTIATSDGTNWLRVSDGNIVS